MKGEKKEEKEPKLDNKILGAKNDISIKLKERLFKKNYQNNKK